MKILVPIDFSPDAEQALRYATALAKLLQLNETDHETATLELLIFHVYHVPIGGDTSFFATTPMIEREEQLTLEKIHKLIGTIPEIQSLPHRIITRLSMPYEGIKEVMEEEKVELVVMGVRGANAATNWLGSTTLQVMRYATCPVLAIPRTAEVFHPQQIAFATDLETNEDTSFLRVFRRLAQLWRATVHFIHVHPNPSQVGVEQAQEALNLDHFLQDIPHTYHFVEDKLPARGIEQYLMKYPTDLLVVIPRHHAALESLFHRSVTKQLATHTSLPILSIHET
ncbi:MAG: universal stress protein [Cyclobacteriaceae bacterium]